MRTKRLASAREVAAKIVNERRKTERRNGIARLLPKMRDWSVASVLLTVLAMFVRWRPVAETTTDATDNRAQTDAQHKNANRVGQPNGAAKRNTERNRRMKRTLNALTTKLAGRVQPFLNIPTALMMTLAVGGFGLSLWMVDDAIEGSMLLAGPGIHNDCAIDAEPYLSTFVVAGPGHAIARIAPRLNGRSEWAGGFGKGDEEIFHGAGHVEAVAGLAFYNQPRDWSDNEEANGSVMAGFKHYEQTHKFIVTRDDLKKKGLGVSIETATEVAGEIIEGLLKGRLESKTLTEGEFEVGTVIKMGWEVTFTQSWRKLYKESLKTAAVWPLVCFWPHTPVEDGASRAHAHVTNAQDFHVTSGEDDVTATWKMFP